MPLNELNKDLSKFKNDLSGINQFYVRESVKKILNLDDYV